MNLLPICLAPFLALATDVVAQTWAFPLSARALFVRANNDVPDAPLVLNLSALGVVPGQWLRIASTGDFVAIGGGQDNFRSLIGVFSGSAALLPPNVQHRVVDAIGAGPSFTSPGTWSGSLPMDIPQDFFCSRMTWGNGIDVPVPPGATHLFLGVHDSLCADNSDPDGDYGVAVTVVPPPSLPGTGEHIVLKSAVNGTPALLPDVHAAPPGSTMTAELSYPLGLLDGELYLFLADVMPTGGSVPNPLPGLYSSNLILLKAGILPSTPGFTDTWSLVAGSGYAGTTAIVQVVALTPIARNGLFESTAAHRFAFQ